MKFFNSSIISIIGILGSSGAMASAPTIDTFNIQSFLKLSNNTPVSATSADFVFAVFKGSNCVWAKRYSAVSINSGVINQKISGNGTNISSINNASATAGECVTNFSGIALNSTLLNTGSPAALSIRIYTETSIDTYKPIWDIPLNSAPTAFIADLANTATTATTANDLSASRKVTTSSGSSDAGKIPALGASGTIDNSMINAAALTIANTQVTGLGTAATLNTGTSSGNIPLLGTGGRLAAAQMPTYAVTKILTTDASGVITAATDAAVAGGGANANKIPMLNGSGLLPNSMIDPTVATDPAYLTSAVPVNKGGTGVTTLTSGNILTGNGTGAITSISTVPVASGGTGATTISTNGLVVGAGTSAVTTIAPGATGTVLLSNGTTWAASLPSASNIVDMTSTQASIAGNKTFTGVVTHSSTTTLTGAVTVSGATSFNSTVKIGSAGTALSSVYKCSVTLTSGGTEVTGLTCTGATATSVVQCSPTTALPSGWSFSSARGSAANQVALKADQVSGATAWTSTAFNCIVFN